MKILVVGGGGREHAIIWKLRESRHNPELHCAPGNAGISLIAECHNVPATDIEGQVALAKELKADFVVVAPDDPLAGGLVDRLEAEGIAAFGPTAAAARIEASKIFAKDLMKKYDIKTADYQVFDHPEAAFEGIKKYPSVIKADGLALGKGVVIAKNSEEALAAIEEIMVDKKFGESGSRIVIEEFIHGPEVSVLAFTDGKNIRVMEPAQDHKRVFDGDKGPNTGGMGTFSPCDIYTSELAERCLVDIYLPTIRAMEQEGCPFKGVIYFGLMIVDGDPYVIEYNARFGDPETQVILPRLKGDLVDIMMATRDGTLDKVEIDWDERAAVCVVLASGGYPNYYAKGLKIEGIIDAQTDGALVFHAGTTRKAGELLTSGGRVLGVVARGYNLDEARDEAYKAVEMINFTGMHYRTDIGIKK